MPDHQTLLIPELLHIKEYDLFCTHFSLSSVSAQPYNIYIYKIYKKWFNNICLYLIYAYILTKKLEMYCHLSTEILCLLIMVWLLLQLCFFKSELILLNRLALTVRPWLHYTSLLLRSLFFKHLFQLPYTSPSLFPWLVCNNGIRSTCVQLGKIKGRLMKEYLLKW